MSIEINNTTANDGVSIWELIKDCSPLDLNSSYLYLILCLHFSETCLVAKSDSQIVGFISSYILPKNKDVLFVWQVAVHEKMRGQGLGKKLLNKLIQQNVCKEIRYITCTISPSNKASKSLFKSFAKNLEADFKENVLFTKDYFPKEEVHEEEALIQIGPLQ